MIMEAKKSIRLTAVGYYLVYTKPLMKMVILALQIAWLFCSIATLVLPTGDVTRCCQILAKYKIALCFCIRRPYQVVKREKTLKLDSV